MLSVRFASALRFGAVASCFALALILAPALSFAEDTPPVPEMEENNAEPATPADKSPRKDGNKTSSPTASWHTSRNGEHPLVGRILDVEQDIYISPEQLIARLAKKHHVLLGEIHDNPDHHLLQAWVIAQLAQKKRTPAVVMEQIRSDQAGLLKLFMSGKHKTAKRMGPAIGWKGSGWPKWEIYQPIAKSALDAGMKIYAGDSSKDMNRQIGKKGFAVLGETQAEEMGLNLPLGRSLDNALLNELVASHCNTLPKKAMKPMALVQRYRDAHLARAMRSADKGDGSILIAGNGHVRSDRAVPWYLRGEQIESVTLMMVEAARGAESPLDLIPVAPSGKATADFIWVTPGVDREDPCIKLRKRFGAASGHGKKARKRKKKSPRKRK